MNALKKITGLVRLTGDKFIVIDEGEPAYVVVPFQEYEQLMTERKNDQVVQYISKGSPKKSTKQLSETEEETILKRVNEDIEAYRLKQAEIRKEEGEVQENRENEGSARNENFSEKSEDLG